MSDNIAIKVDGVNKSFKLPHEKVSSIKSAVVNFYKRKRTFEKQEVLKDISFEIKKGEFFGIVGRNGSGKSTLLKLLAGIYTPDSGQINVNGKLTPFIELGVGFSPELTGRENVFLNGALLGFSKKEMEKMYDEIVEFAELERFMDQKLKNYSSGMQVRLAFSIAIRANTDILILDEVLAVGDERFQEKCVGVFEDLKKAGKTIVLVTHDMSSVERFCTKAVVISDGKLVYSGQANEATYKYTELNFPETLQPVDTVDKMSDKTQIKVTTVNGQASNKTLFKSNDNVKFDITWKHTEETKNVGVAIYSDDGQYVYGTNTIIDKSIPKKGSIMYEVKLNLGAGNYYMQLGIYGASNNKKIYFSDRALSFRVVNNQQWQGLTRLQHKWGN